MASAFTHAVAALALGEAVRPGSPYWKTAALGVFCAVAPDLDVLGFAFGVPYHSVWGHRGWTHSLLFAAALAAALAALCYPNALRAERFAAAAYLFGCGASHGLLDMMTDGGGGVALFAPFSTARLFLPWRPILVSPIGVRPFFTGYGARVLASEIQYVWWPAGILALLLRSLRLGWFQ